MEQSKGKEHLVSETQNIITSLILIYRTLRFLNRDVDGLMVLEQQAGDNVSNRAENGLMDGVRPRWGEKLQR